MAIELRTHALQLSGSCNPLDRVVLVSKHICSPYRILGLAVNFPSGCDGLVRTYLFVDIDPSTGTITPPFGTSILSMLSRDDFLVGNDINLTLAIHLPVPVKGTWLKAYIVNDDGFPHTISVLFTLQEMLEP